MPHERPIRRTKAEQEAWERQCYGSLEREWLPFAKDALRLTSFEMLVMGLLSDAQEDTRMRRPDRANQTINRAKFLLAHRRELMAEVER